MKRVAVPNPNEPLSLDGGKTLNPAWHRFLVDLANAVNSLLPG